MAPLFQTTSWSLLSQTRDSNPAAREAAATLCRMYWRPLYVYARRTGLREHEAEDAVQGFLVHVVEHDVCARADAERGRFRTFLLSSLQQYLARRVRDANRQKRTSRTPLLSLDRCEAEAAAARAGDGEASPTSAFEREWARAQLELAWRAVEAEYAASGKSDVFNALRSVIAGQSDLPARQIAAELHMSEGAVNVASHRLRRRFGAALRAQISLTLGSEDEIDDEIARLRQALSQGGDGRR